MLRDNPLLTLLGRRGRGAVVDILRADPTKPWSVRELARAADVPVATASRAVAELDALGVVDAIRPGREKIVRWEADSAVARALLPFVVPDLRRESATTFAGAYRHPATLVHWHMPGDAVDDPMCPTRLAILVRDDEDAAWDAVGPALDAVERAGWPKPDATVLRRDELDDGEVAQAVRGGRIVT